MISPRGAHSAAPSRPMIFDRGAHTLEVFRDCTPARLTVPGRDRERGAIDVARSRAARYRMIAARAVTTRPDWEGGRPLEPQHVLTGPEHAHFL